jgi:predicted  nucleic acid-binding Zn-ribbon protein
MTEALPRLLSLQACDQRIREALHTIESLRTSLAAVEEQTLANVQTMQVCHVKIKKAAQARDAFVTQLDQIKDQLREKKRSEHRRRVGEAKAYGQREITLLDVRKAAIEKKLCIVEAQITEDYATLHQAEETAPTRAEEWQRTTAALLDQLAATQGVLSSAQEERTALTLGIPPFVLYEYERIFTHRGGIAVVAIEHETCQGCHMHVPAHLCLELQKTPKLTFCPNCHRIVFVANEATISRSLSHRPTANERQTRRPPG